MERIVMQETTDYEQFCSATEFKSADFTTELSTSQRTCLTNPEHTHKKKLKT